MFWKPELKTSFLKARKFPLNGKISEFLEFKFKMFKFLCTMSSYRIRYAEKNLPGITYRLLGVTENKIAHHFGLLKYKVNSLLLQNIEQFKTYTSGVRTHDINYWIEKKKEYFFMTNGY